MFHIIELYYIVCFFMTNKSIRTFYVNKSSVIAIEYFVFLAVLEPVNIHNLSRRLRSSISGPYPEGGGSYLVSVTPFA